MGACPQAGGPGIGACPLVSRPCLLGSPATQDARAGTLHLRLRMCTHTQWGGFLSPGPVPPSKQLPGCTASPSQLAGPSSPSTRCPPSTRTRTTVQAAAQWQPGFSPGLLPGPSPQGSPGGLAGCWAGRGEPRAAARAACVPAHSLESRQEPPLTARLWGRGAWLVASGRGPQEGCCAGRHARHRPQMGLGGKRSFGVIFRPGRREGDRLEMSERMRQGGRSVHAGLCHHRTSCLPHRCHLKTSAPDSICCPCFVPQLREQLLTL